MTLSLRARQVNNVTSLTEGSVCPAMLRFALPIFISQVFQQLYNTADAFIVGRYLGTAALAAVSSSGSLILLITSFFIGATMGAGVVISRWFGAGCEENVSRAIHTDIALGLAGGLALSAIGMALTPTLLRWMNTDAEVLPQAIEYFRCYFAGSLAVMMYNTCRSIMNALGDSRRPLWYLVLSSLLNIALDLLFVGGFGWGVWSAAVATVISQAASAVLCLIHLSRKGQIYTISVRKLHFHRDMLREILRNGLPSGVQNSVISLANVIVQSQINTFGMLAMAAFGTHARLEGFAFLPITSFSMAITTFISQNLGAGRHDRAKKGARFGILLAVALAELVGAVYFIFAPGLIALFDATPGVVALGVRQAHIEALFFFLLAFSHSVAAVCRGAGKATVPMLIMLSVWCVFRIAYIWFVMRVFRQIDWIYAAYPITWCISSVIYLLYYLRSDWVHSFDPKPARTDNL